MLLIAKFVYIAKGCRLEVVIEVRIVEGVWENEKNWAFNQILSQPFSLFCDFKWFHSINQWNPFSALSLEKSERGEKRKEQKFNTKGKQKLFYSRTESSYGYIVLYWLSFRILKIFHTNCLFALISDHLPHLYIQPLMIPRVRFCSMD